MKYEVTWPAAWAQSRRHCQRATSSARPLKKGSTDAAPRDSRGLWQHATLSEERGQHRRSTAGPENRSTFTPPRGLKVERGERAGSSLAEKRGGLPPPSSGCCRVVYRMFPWHVVSGMLSVACRVSNVPVACCIWNVVSCMSLSIIAGVPLLIFSDLVWLVWPGLARLGLVLLVLGSFHAVDAVS